MFGEKGAIKTILIIPPGLSLLVFLQVLMIRQGVFVFLSV